jgi:hypothetical protein
MRPENLIESCAVTIASVRLDWSDGHEVVAMASGLDLLDTMAVSLHPEFGSGHFDLVISEARMLDAEEAKVLVACATG